jgi:crotonobetainyl-CoA:carnitine CoA-transferase CaiB-like acyl-CoA transferase
MDHICGFMGAYAVLGALNNREARDHGVHIDLSNREVGMALVGHVFQDVPDRDGYWSRTGNTRPLRVPCGVYPSQGVDSWVAVDVGTENQWTGFVRCLGLEGFVAEHALTGLDGRLSRRELIDEKIAEWTSARTADEAANELQGHGVPAHKVARADDIVVDEHLAERGTIFSMLRPNGSEISRRTAVGPPWLFSNSAVKNDVWSPELGEDTDYVLEEILGYESDTIEALRACNALA